jgi:hypothetical protein
MKWTSTAGPRQTKSVSDAINALNWRGKTRREILDSGPMEFVNVMGQPSAECQAAQQDIGERYDWTVTRENYGEIVVTLEAARAALKIPTVDKRTTPEQREQLAREAAERESLRAREAAEKRDAIAKHVAELREQYPYAVAGGAEGKYSSHARAAKNIKLELARAFPGVKFSVSSRSYSGGNSVDIHWDNGPTSSQVDEILGKYQMGSFDGMQDLYEYDHSAHGEAVDIVLGRARHVHGSRNFPDDVRAVVMRSLCELQRVEFNGPNTRHVYGAGDGETLDVHAWRIFSECSIPAGATVVGVEHVPDDERQAFRSSYRLALKLPEQPATAPVEKLADAPSSTAATVQRHVHTRKGTTFFLVVLKDRVERDEFERLRDACKSRGGWYSRQFGATPGGFAFEEELAANEFSRSLTGS